MSMRKGFTLVEMILYVALLAIMMGAALPIALQLVTNGTKSGITQEVYHSARYASERIMYEIRNANGIYDASSTFDVDIATTTGAALYLIGASPATDPTVITVASGTLQIRQGAGDPVALNSVDSRVASLIFSNYSTSTYNNVGFVLTMANAATSTRQEYRASTTINTSVGIRSK